MSVQNVFKPVWWQASCKKTTSYILTNNKFWRSKNNLSTHFLDLSSSYFFKKSLGIVLVSAIFFLAAWVDTWEQKMHNKRFSWLVLEISVSEIRQMPQYLYSVPGWSHKVSSFWSASQHKLQDHLQSWHCVWGKIYHFLRLYILSTHWLRSWRRVVVI